MQGLFKFYVSTMWGGVYALLIFDVSFTILGKFVEYGLKSGDPENGCNFPVGEGGKLGENSEHWKI